MSTVYSAPGFNGLGANGCHDTHYDSHDVCHSKIALTTKDESRNTYGQSIPAGRTA